MRAYYTIWFHLIFIFNFEFIYGNKFENVCETMANWYQAHGVNWLGTETPRVQAVIPDDVSFYDTIFYVSVHHSAAWGTEI